MKRRESGEKYTMLICHLLSVKILSKSETQKKEPTLKLDFKRNCSLILSGDLNFYDLSS